MAAQELLWLSLSDIAAQIQRQEVSPVELTGAVLERLEHLNPRLNAFITILGEQALHAAQRAEQDVLAGRRCGPLHGAPLALKDIFAMRGVRTTAGSQVLASWVPDEDATVVARLKAAGAILVGTLNLYEFATGAVLNPHYGPTHNPWHLDHTTGGSSTGSGADGAAAREPWIRSRREVYGADLRERMHLGLLVPATAYLKAQRRRAAVRRDLEQAFEKVDMLATPTAAIPAPKPDAGPGEIGAPTGALRGTLRRLTQPFNITGSPAITVPCGFSRDGLPIGLQLVGRPFEEARLLNLAYAYEQSTPWKDRHPAL